MICNATRSIYGKFRHEKYTQGICPACIFSESELLLGFLGRLDHLADHLTADGAGLLAGQVAVVALLQIDADLP